MDRDTIRIRDRLDLQFRRFARTLSKEEKEALSWYTYMGNGKINGALRTGEWTEKTTRAVRVLDALFQRAPRTPRGLHVYRAIPSRVGRMFLRDPYAVDHERGYLSTSLDGSIGQMFDLSQIFRDEEKVEEIPTPFCALDIMLPPGLPFLYMNGLFPHVDAWESEYEVLLPRDVKLRMVDRDVRRKYGFWGWEELLYLVMQASW